MQPAIFNTLLLLALPASGKSEVRKYLRQLSADVCRNDFHLGETIQLDDFPYVHIFRRIDEELTALCEPRLFFDAPDRSFKDPFVWGTLIHLINEDYEDLFLRKVENPTSATQHLFDRIDRASGRTKAKVRIRDVAKKIREQIAPTLENEVREMLIQKQESFPSTLERRTVVIEFARGGAANSSMPFPEPFGYQYSLSQLSERILNRAVILYVWVTPEDSRRKNQERGNPNDPGSILHHSVPLEVMMNDYGCDDMDWLESNSGSKEGITVEAGGKKFMIPTARFDNRLDKTSFIRKDKADWGKEEVHAIHQGLKDSFERLAARSKSIYEDPEDSLRPKNLKSRN